VKFNKGTVFKYSGSGSSCGREIGMILSRVQLAWGAEKYKVIFSNGIVGYVWDKHIAVIEQMEKR